MEISEALIDTCRQAMEEKFELSELNLFVFGQSGIGKTSIVNTLLGKDVGAVSADERMTNSVRCFGGQIRQGRFPSIRYNICDTPGIVTADTSLTDEQIRKIVVQIKKTDCVLYVSRLDFHRIDQDREIISGLSRVLQFRARSRFWEHAVIVLTHEYAASTENAVRLSHRADQFREIIREQTDLAISKAVPVISVSLPGPGSSRKKSKNAIAAGKIFTEVFMRISEKGLMPLVLVTADRVDVDTTILEQDRNIDNNQIVLPDTAFWASPKDQERVLETIKKWFPELLDVFSNLISSSPISAIKLLIKLFAKLKELSSEDN